MKSKKHLGSNFDQFLEEEGLLSDAGAVAAKRIISFQNRTRNEEKTDFKNSNGD